MALLFLDGQLGPASFTLRRAAALTVLAVVGAVRIRGLPQWLVAAAAVAALALLPRAPSAPLALVALVIALAAITPAAGWRPGAVPIANGLVAACLSYVLLRFATDLVPQAGAMPAAAGRLGSLYIDGAGRVNAKLSFTALGGPAVSLATLYLLWSWRRAGGPRRLAAAVAIPIGWFALLPVEASDLGAGPLAAFWRGAWYGMAWLGIATFVAVAAASSAQRASQRNGTSNAAGRAPLVAAFAAAAFAGVCLVGTGCIEPRAARHHPRPQPRRTGLGAAGLWPLRCLQRRHVRHLARVLPCRGVRFRRDRRKHGRGSRPTRRSNPCAHQFAENLGPTPAADDLRLRGAGRQPAGTGRSYRRLRPDARVQQPLEPTGHPFPVRLGLQGSRDLARLPGCRARRSVLGLGRREPRRRGWCIARVIRIGSAAPGRPLWVFRSRRSRKCHRQLSGQLSLRPRRAIGRYRPGGHGNLRPRPGRGLGRHVGVSGGEHVLSSRGRADARLAIASSRVDGTTGCAPCRRDRTARGHCLALAHGGDARAIHVDR